MHEMKLTRIKTVTLKCAAIAAGRKSRVVLMTLSLLVMLPVLTLCGCNSGQAEPKEYKVLLMGEIQQYGDYDKYRAALESQINEQAKQGWKFHSAFYSGRVGDIVILGR